jgi:hypothetical protein
LSWVVYSKPQCSLCETFLAELAEVVGAQAAHVAVVDITSDPELERKYGARIPVLTVDGDFVCAYRVDRERVERYLGSPGGLPV